jgi:nicotinate-nucleotide adenylyltransferase
MPTGRPARKTERTVTSAEHRYLMTVIATASNPDFVVSRLEIDRPGVTYTVDTILELKSMHGPDADLFFITGADAVLDILTWKDSARLADACTFIAATRPGYDLERFVEIPGSEHLSVEFMEVPALAISSTDIRARFASRRPVRYLLPEAVATYVSKNELYAGGV